MRYSIMLQIVTFLTMILVGAAALFAWIQNRPNSPQSVNESRDEKSSYEYRR
jgi:flagellar basal body-associated protein FliL